MSDGDELLGELTRLVVSDDPAEVDRAHEQALSCMSRVPRMRVVAAMAYDRTRVFAGRRQKFGTQAVLRAGERELWPVDRKTTDSERAKWGVGPLAMLRREVSMAPLVGKAPLRRLLRKRRAEIDDATVAAAAERIATHGLDALADELADGATIAAYWPLPGEADPRPLARALAARCGGRLALPVVHAGEGAQMSFREWRQDAALEPAGFGTFGPGPGARELAPDLVLAPLLGFDDRGARLGQGRGYDDRKLAGREGAAAPRFVGIAWASQELPAVPTERHDLALDLVVTEVAATRFGTA